MLAVLFAVSYQSIHTFSHDHHLAHSCCDEVGQESNYKINFSETEECPICEFKFASFLAPEITTYTFFEPPLKFLINSMQLKVAKRSKENQIL